MVIQHLGGGGRRLRNLRSALSAWRGQGPCVSLSLKRERLGGFSKFWKGGFCEVLLTNLMFVTNDWNFCAGLWLLLSSIALPDPSPCNEAELTTKVFCSRSRVQHNLKHWPKPSDFCRSAQVWDAPLICGVFEGECSAKAKFSIS